MLPGLRCFWEMRSSFLRFSTSFSLFPLLDLLQKWIENLKQFSVTQYIYIYIYIYIVECRSTDLAYVSKKFHMFFRYDSFNSPQSTLCDKHSQEKFSLKRIWMFLQFTIWTSSINYETIAIPNNKSMKLHLFIFSKEQHKITKNSNLCFKVIFGVSLPLQQTLHHAL